jgi:hypothetical protein
MYICFDCHSGLDQACPVLDTGESSLLKLGFPFAVKAALELLSRSVGRTTIEVKEQNIKINLSYFSCIGILIDTNGIMIFYCILTVQNPF